MSAAPLQPQAKTALLVPPENLDTPGHRRVLTLAARFVFWLIDSYFDWKVVGLEQIPTTGPLLITINHLSVFDLPTLGSVMIKAGWQPGVNMFTIAKKEVFEKPVLPYFAGQLGLFPVHRNTLDVNAMRTILYIFKRGGALGIAPEGTRSPTGHLQLFQPSVAKIAIQKKIPILPIGLVGMEQVMPIGSKFPRRVPIEIHFGPLYELSEYYDKALTPDELERAAWDMRAHIAALLPEWMRELPPQDAQVRFGSVLSAEAKT
ncbi:MAG: 1-acyl-sn-glycerol-3-phosphate acyltransferase [Chloroflexota bacterium]|nr:MAG: 1-acyl-sn-glycerol-3-phosphate acyltransferase [Chloroflexota bacterium]